MLSTLKIKSLFVSIGIFFSALIMAEDQDSYFQPATNLESNNHIPLRNNFVVSTDNWDIFIENPNIADWIIPPLIVLSINVSGRKLSNYVFDKGFQFESVALIGTAFLLKKALEYTQAGLVIHSAYQLSANTLSTVHSILSEKSQSNFLSFTPNASSTSFITHGRALTLPSTFYIQGEDQRHKLWLGTEILRFTLQVLTIPVSYYLQQKLFTEKITAEPSNQLMENTLTPGRIKNAHELIRQITPLIIDTSTATSIPQRDSVLSAKGSEGSGTEVQILTERVLHEISVIPPSIKTRSVGGARKIYSRAEDYIGLEKLKHHRNELNNIAFNIFYGIVTKNPSLIENKCVAVTGGQAQRMHHRKILSVPWAEYQSMSSDEVISTNDLDLIVFNSKAWDWEKEITDLRELKYTPEIYEQTIKYSTKFTSNSGVETTSLFFGFEDKRRFITVYSIDVTLKNEESSHSITSLQCPNSLFVPTMPLSYEAKNIDVAMAAMPTEEEKYLNRLRLIALSEGKRLGIPGNTERATDPDFADVVTKHYDELVKPSYMRQKEKRKIQKITKSFTSTKTNSRSADNILTPSSQNRGTNDDSERYSVLPRKSNRKVRDKIPADLPTVSEESINRASISFSRRHKNSKIIKIKDRKKFSLNLKSPYIIITTAVVLPSLFYFVYVEKQSDSKNEFPYSQKKTIGAVSVIVNKKEYVQNKLHKWQYELEHSIGMIDCFKIKDKTFKQYCEKNIKDRNFIFSTLFKKLSVISESFLIPYVEIAENGDRVITHLFNIKKIPYEELTNLISLNLLNDLDHLDHLDHLDDLDDFDDMSALDVMEYAANSILYCGYFPGSYSDTLAWYSTCISAIKNQSFLNQKNKTEFTQIKLISLITSSLKQRKMKPGQYVIALPEVVIKNKRGVSVKPYLIEYTEEETVLKPYTEKEQCASVNNNDFYILDNNIDFDSLVTIGECNERNEFDECNPCPSLSQKPTIAPMAAYTNDPSPNLKLWTFIKGTCISAPWDLDFCSKQMDWY